MNWSGTGVAKQGPRQWPLISFALLFFALFGGLYAWTARKQVVVAPDARETVRISTVAYVGSCPILMAEANGYFASEGVAAVISVSANGKAALNEALHGRSDLATVADIPIMFAALSGEPVSVVASITTMEDHGIIGRRDRGVVTPASLKGRRVGVTMGTTTQYFLDSFLNRHQLSPADVIVVNQAPVELVESLSHGDIDAIVSYQPFLNMSLATLGAAAVVFSREGMYDVLFALAGTHDYVKAHSQTIERILRATIRGAQFCKDTPDVARAAVAKFMKTDSIALKEIWPSYRFEVALRQGLLLVLEDEARWAIRNKLTAATNVPNFLNNLSLDPLRSVAPTAVTVIH